MSKQPTPPIPPTPDRRDYPQTPLWKIFLEVVAVVVVAAYTTIAYFQLKATLRIMRVEQRAWIVPSYSAMNLKTGEVIFLQMFCTNAGKTPAKNIQGVFRMEAIRYADEPAFDYSSKQKSEENSNVIFPGDHITLGVPLLKEGTGTNTAEPIAFTDDLNKRFLDREIVFITYGKVTYEDAFGEKHWVTFCSSTVPARTGMISRSVARQKCSQYNNVDQE